MHPNSLKILVPIRIYIWIYYRGTDQRIRIRTKKITDPEHCL